MIKIELYIKEITRFLSTMTIKNNYFKDQMEEQWVADAYRGKLSNNAHPYYRHLLGDYILKDLSTFRSVSGISSDEMSDEEVCSKYGLSLYTDIGGIIVPNSELYTQFDDLVMIRSVDTKTPVPFTKKMLSDEQHQKTATLYRMPSRYYEKIRTRFSAQADIIKAIVYPVASLEDCVKAPNYSLISCDLTQLKENERSSMYSCVCETLAVIQRRWDVPEFVYEDLYALSIQAKIWDILLLALMEQRIKNVRTSATHEYHIWEYLKSKGCDDYSDVLSLKQAIFLYRNFPYILRHRGTEKNLLLLAHKLLSDWDIVITHKNLLQQTSTEASKFLSYQENGQFPTRMREVSKSGSQELSMTESCETFPVVDNIEIGKHVMERLRTIDNTDDNPFTTYHNKTLKFKDELDALDEQTNDYNEMSIGTTELLEDVFAKEKTAGIEYDNENLYARSTKEQRIKFTRTPHTYLPTKILEISKATASSLFQQIYAKFVTESLIYQVATRNIDHYISFIPDGLSYSVDITVKEAIALIVYCALKEAGLYETGTMLRSKHLVTMPYKSTFPTMREEYIWRGTDQKTKNALSIIPMSIQVTCDSLDPKYTGLFELTNPSADRVDYLWTNSLGSSMRCVDDKRGYYWTIENDRSVLRSEFGSPYSNWHYWTMTWSSGSSSHVSSLEVLSDYRYVLDKYMPLEYDDLYSCTWYKRQFNGNLDDYKELVELVNAQAEGYIKIYREIHGSDWSRQRTAINQIMTDRTYCGVVELDLLNGDTFEDYLLTASADLRTVLTRIESESESVKRTEYAKLGNSITKALLPIDSEYFLDNAGSSANRFNRLKELFTNLCSYNITFLEGDVGSEDFSMTGPGYTTQDMIQVNMGWSLHDSIDTCDLMPLVVRHTEFLPMEQIHIGSSVVEQPPITPFYAGTYHANYTNILASKHIWIDGLIRSKYTQIVQENSISDEQLSLLPADTPVSTNSNYHQLATYITNMFGIEFNPDEHRFDTLGEVVEYVQSCLTNQHLEPDNIFHSEVSVGYGLETYQSVIDVTVVSSDEYVVRTESN